MAFFEKILGTKKKDDSQPNESNKTRFLNNLETFLNNLLNCDRYIADYIDFENKIVYELKPNNPSQIKKGTKQLAGYFEEIETVFGKGWSSVLDTY